MVIEKSSIQAKSILFIDCEMSNGSYHQLSQRIRIQGRVEVVEVPEKLGGVRVKLLQSVKHLQKGHIIWASCNDLSLDS